MIAAVTCLCGGSDSLVRNFLQSAGYKDWLSIPVHRGREKSLSVVNVLPPSVEKDILKSYIEKSSKWAVIIGYDEKTCRWSDIAHNGPKSGIEAEFVVRAFSGLDEKG